MLEGNSDFKRVTNKTNLTVSARNEWTSLSAYKILDIYYNETTNEMTYGFTTDFKSFIDQLPSGDDFYNLTIEKYQELTSDEYHGSNPGIVTTSTLNKLVSKYAVYLKKINIADKQILITKQYGNTDESVYQDTIEVGSYLVIPTTSNAYTSQEASLMHSMYGVGVANVIFSVSQGNWKLNVASMYLKDSAEFTGSTIFNGEIDVFLNQEEFKHSLTYSADNGLYFFTVFADGYGNSVPTNTHSSILNNSAIMDKILKREIIFSQGLTYDLNEIYSIYYDYDEDKWVYFKAIIKDNSIYGLDEDGVTEMKLVDFTENTDTNSIIFKNWLSGSYSSMLFFKLKANNNIKLGTTTNADQLANYGNVITTNAYYLKDAYVDISGMSQEEAEAKVLGVGTLTNTVYTYGVKVTNKDNSTLLNGAKFQVCLDKDCNTKVGEEFEITEKGTYTFKGLNDTDTYYLKQTKASTGYRVADSVELKPTSLNKETGFYDVEVTSKKMGLLPSTGGLGTILYTTFGLLIIVVGSITFISYRKRQVN